MTSTPLVQPASTYWHFLSPRRCLQYRDGREVVVGETLRVEGSPVLCKHGLHASAQAIDALSKAPGPIACLVTLGGEIAHGKDKSAAQERTVFWMVDATRLLRDFACNVAEIALERERERGREPDPRSWAAVEVMRRFLRGDASEGERYTAWAAARAAAWDAYDASNAAAHAAAYAAVYAVDDAAYAAAASAANAASYAAMRAANVAANAASYAAMRVAAKAAAYATCNVRLTQLLLAAGQVEAIA